jgi:tagaturonate reductase
MLKKLDRKNAAVPQTRPVKVLQFGGGNFLRGFADWIVDVLNEKAEFNGAIDIITSVTPGTAEQINEQDGLYYLVTQGTVNGKQVSETRLITSVNRAINPAKDFNEFVRCGQNPDLRFIISNTTEAGIAFDESDISTQTLPKSFPGKLTLLLYERYKFYNGSLDKTIIVLPCELIENNADKLKEIVLRYASHWKLDAAFIDWINHNTFCNTLVDRIVPGFPKETITKVQDETGYDDKLTVAAEPFYFWAIEGPSSVQKEFPTDIAKLSNVIFTNDIAPYRLRKVRILNGAHTALTPVAYLRGIRTVKEAMDDSYVSEFIRETISGEIIPTLPLSPNELVEFANAVSDRFKNPFIKHQLISISLNSISKFKVRVLPTLVDYLAIKKRLPDHLVSSFAALICFYKGEWNGAQIPLNDSPEVLAVIKRAWDQDSIDETVSIILSDKLLWDADLTKIDGLLASTILKVHELKTSSLTKAEV